MNAIIPTATAVVPQARVPFSVRVATMADVPFMDSMQKQFGKQLGYFPTKQFEGYVALGAILIAEEKRSADFADCADLNSNSSAKSASSADQSSPIGYVISRDRYLKRDELGVIYQLCVAPGTQRKLVGASLIAEVFRRSAYGCKLYCCWCAQDLSANYFWESIGFVPIAFRAGSAKKSRVHIFWQRRIHQDDVTTPWWYPCATNGGAIREDRLVFPIPPGVHWKDVTAVAVPRQDAGRALPDVRSESDTTGAAVPQKKKRPAKPDLRKTDTPPGESTRQQISTGRLFFGATAKVEAKMPFDKAQGRKSRAPRVKTKNDPALAAKARELRDRWMEQLNQNPQMLLGDGKYEVGREANDEVRLRRAQSSRTMNDERVAKPVLALPQAA